MSHSKGPWKWEKESEWPSRTKRHLPDADGKSLMCDETYYPWCPNSDADWDLIAAAPELLEALKDILILPQVDVTHAANRAKSAIAKAEGR